MSDRLWRMFLSLNKFEIETEEGKEVVLKYEDVEGMIKTFSRNRWIMAYNTEVKEEHNKKKEHGF